ncbi:hypothetical protein HZA44_00315 [Candidatus Peregrinibacteria bacterium]|nr:hypothetical protein [Candidatus Peregrinibacteria bacterium]
MPTPETDQLKAVVAWLKQFFMTREEFKQELAIERARSDVTMLDTLINSSEEHLEEKRAMLNGNPNITETEKANVRQVVRQGELWGQHLRKVRSDFAKRVDALINTPKK